MTALAKTKKTSKAAKPARGQVEVFISRGKVLLHLAFWSAALMAIGWVFILPYRELSGAAGREFPHRLIELLGDEFFLGVGVLICGLILWYMAIMAAKMLVKGPLFRVSKEAIHHFWLPYWIGAHQTCKALLHSFEHLSHVVKIEYAMYAPHKNCSRN